MEKLFDQQVSYTKTEIEVHSHSPQFLNHSGVFDGGPANTFSVLKYMTSMVKQRLYY